MRGRLTRVQSKLYSYELVPDVADGSFIDWNGSHCVKCVLKA